MFSKSVGVMLFALGCLTAAAGGAYVATRHNASDAAVVAAQPAAPTPGAIAKTGQPPATQPVAETEAVVSPRAADASPAAAEAAAPPVEASAARGAQRPSPPQVSSAPSPKLPASRPAPTATPHDESPAAATSVQRTVPMTNPGTPVSQADGAPWQPTAAPASKASAEATKPNDDPPADTAHAPQFDELILPAASVIGLQVETSMSTERARIEDRVDARVSRDVMAGGRVAIPAGSRVIGSVTTVERGGKVKEQARLGIRFHTLVLADGTQMQLNTDPVYRLGEPPAASSSKKIGGAAIGGAILGAILGGGKGAAAGGAIGAGAGTAAVMTGDRSAAALRQGEYLNVKLASPATLTVERRE
jgi:hypothetical protein